MPPFVLASGDRARLYGLNLVGLKRKGFSPQVLSALKLAYRFFFRSDLTLQQALDRAPAELPDLPEVRLFIEFLRHSQRGITR